MSSKKTRTDEREKGTPGAGLPASGRSDAAGDGGDESGTVDHEPPPPGGPGRAVAGVALAGIVGIVLTFLATGLQGGGLLAMQRQASALEDIALSLRTGCRPAGDRDPEPTPSPILFPMVFEDTGANEMVFEDTGANELCSVVYDGTTLRVEGPHPERCQRWLSSCQRSLDCL